MAIKVVVEFLASVLSASEMPGQRGRLDMFADRIMKAASEPTLGLAIEHLMRSVNASPDKINPHLATRMMAVAASEDGARILRWWREQAKTVSLLAGTKDKTLVDEVCEKMVLPAATTGGRANVRGSFKIKLLAECEAPLSHGADTKAGNATLFRRMQVLTDSGVASLPYYAGNAVRGQVRDLLADHFLASLGLTVSRSRPSVALWFFYALYSGGALEENSDATKALRKGLGDNGTIRAAGIRELRDMLPAISVLGCALGNRVLPGRCQFSDLRPVCYEWGTGERPIAELMSWEYLTRREDHENYSDHHGMIANTEVLRAGTVLEGGVDYDNAIRDVELAALGRGLSMLAERGQLGAENRRGLGRVRITVDGLPDPGPYDAFLAETKGQIIEYLRSIGALAETQA